MAMLTCRVAFGSPCIVSSLKCVSCKESENVVTNCVRNLWQPLKSIQTQKNICVYELLMSKPKKKRVQNCLFSTDAQIANDMCTRLGIKIQRVRTEKKTEQFVATDVTRRMANPLRFACANIVLGSV